LATSFELCLPLFDHLYKPHILTKVTILSLSLSSLVLTQHFPGIVTDTIERVQSGESGAPLRRMFAEGDYDMTTTTTTTKEGGNTKT